MVKLKTKRHLKTVSFDEEIISKDSASKLLSSEEQKNKIKKENNDVETEKKENGENGNINESKRKKSKRKKTNNGIENLENKNNDLDSQVEIETKRKKVKSEISENINANEIVSDDVNKKIRKNKAKCKTKNNVNGDEMVQEVSGANIDSEVEHKVKREQSEVNPEEKEEISESKIKRKKKKKVNEEVIEQSETTDEVTVEDPKVKTSESIRAKKRQKHAKLLEKKRLLSEQTNQQNVLNYLSKWKHCRNEWKFEKLKQIWLQQNMFDTSKIPNEFWETVVEYFTESKGFIRNVIMRDALKIIEKEDQAPEENTEENYLLILQRARDIVQNLQE